MTILLDEFLDFGALKAIGDLKNKNTYNFQKDADRKAILPYLKSVAGETAKYQYNKKYNKSITRKFSKLIFGKESSNSKILMVIGELSSHHLKMLRSLSVERKNIR